MSTLSNIKSLSGKTATIGPAADIFEGGGGVTLSPAPYKGSLAYSGAQIYFSDGDNWIAVEPADISTPKALSPSNSLQQRQMRLSGFSTTLPDVTQTGITFIISLNRNMLPSTEIQVISTTANSYELQLFTPITIQPGQKFYWRAQYTASGNRVSPLSGVKEQQFPYYIDKPTVITTPEIITNIIKISNYNSAFAVNLNPNDNVTHSYTEWEAYKTNEAIEANKIFTPSYKDFTKATSIDVSKLQLVPSNQVYYWRARNVGISNTIGIPLSPWTELAKQTQIDKILNPLILSDINTAVKQLRISEYVSADSSALLNSLWEIYDSNKKLIVELEKTGNTLETEEILSVSSTLKRGDTTPYYWRARYLNVNGVYSQYTTNTPSLFFIPYKIDTPKSSGMIEGAVNTTLTVTQYSSKYGLTNVRSEWEIYNSNITNFQIYQNNAVAGGWPKRFSITEAFNNNFIIVVGAAGLAQGNTYYWRSRYIGKDANNVQFESEWSDLKSYKQAASIKKPIITSPAVGSRDKLKSTINFVADSFDLAIRPASYSEEHMSTIWQLSRANANGEFVPYKTVTFRLNETIVRINEQGVESVGTVTGADLISWRNKFVIGEENSSYKIKVQYIGINDSSEFSDEIQFTTQTVFQDVIDTPTLIPSATGTPYGTFMEGGYYAGKIWNKVAQSSNSEVLNVRVPLNIIDTDQSDSIFKRTKNELNYTFNDYILKIDINQNNTPIFYIGQMVEVRAKSDTTQRLRGYIKGAYGNEITVGVVTTYVTNLTLQGKQFTGGYHIMALYNLFLAPKAEGSYSADIWNSTTSLSNFFPEASKSLAEGYASTKALAELPSTVGGVFFANHISPAAKLAVTKNINSKRDWYIPSRDELDLIVRTLNVADLSTYSSFGGIGYNRDDPLTYNTYGELPDIPGLASTSEKLGVNKNAFLDAPYTDSSIPEKYINLNVPYASSNKPVVNTYFKSNVPASEHLIENSGQYGAFNVSTSTLFYSGSTNRAMAVTIPTYYLGVLVSYPLNHVDEASYTSYPFRLIRRQLA